MKWRMILAVALILTCAGSAGAAGETRSMADCQKARQETWVMHKGDRLDFLGWCHHPEPGNLEPRPFIGTLIRLIPGQTIKVRGVRWGQGVMIECGKPCFNWGNTCEWFGGDLPKGSVFTIVCKP